MSEYEEHLYKAYLPKRIGINPNSAGIIVRGVNHLSECVVARYPAEFGDDDCSCSDYNP